MNCLLALFARMRERLLRARLGDFQFRLALLRSRQAIGDFLCPRVNRLYQRRPDKPHRNPRENEKSIATPTPIRNAASIRPASRNILVCNGFINSGWRAQASIYLPPISAMPRHAPIAPSPMMTAIAIAVMP